MTSLSRIWALVGMLAFLVEAAPLGKNTTGAHTHSTAQQGGTSLLPVTLTVSGTSTTNGPAVINGGATLGSVLTQLAGSSSTFNGASLFNGTMTVSAPSLLGADATTAKTPGSWCKLATSIDGATENSGCFVVATYTSTAAAAGLVFTSTATAGIDLRSLIPAVLMQDGVAPGAQAIICSGGIFRIKTTNALAANSYIESSATRCNIELKAALDNTTAGSSKTTVAVNANDTPPVWIRPPE